MALPRIFYVLVALFVVTFCLLMIFQLISLLRFKHLQRRYSRAILATKGGVWEWFPASNRLYMSSEFFLQLGFEENQTPKKLTDWLALLSSQDQIAFKEWQKKLLNQGVKSDDWSTLRLRLKNPQGTFYWVEIRGSVVRRDARQGVKSAAGIMEDIGYWVDTENELIAAREQAQQRELTLSTLLNNMPDVVWYKDEAGRYLNCNQVFFDFHRLKVEAVQGKTDVELNLDGLGEIYHQRDQSALLTGQTVQDQSWGYSETLQEDRLFEIHRVPVIESSIYFRGTLSIARDITERQDLINQLKLFKSFADNSAQGFAMGSLTGEVSYLNKSIRALLGIAEDTKDKELAQYRHLDFYPQSMHEFIKMTVIPYVREHGVWQGELQAKSLDGYVFPTYETYFILKDETDKPTSVGNIMSDITDQKQVSQQLEQAKEAAEQANQAKSHFLANMSHEIRTPLNAIIGYAQLIGEENTLTGVARNRFMAIASAGERLLSLINDILDIARIESGRLVLHEQKMDLCKEVKQVGKLLQGQAESKGLIFQVTCDLQERQMVRSDPVKFHQILTNLVGNAVKFTQQGYVKVIVSISHERIHIRIEDTGPGIESELMEHLFTPFVQGKAGELSGGTGLGLALSTTLVKLMEGKLSVKSSLGVGTQILVDLPLLAVEDTLEDGVQTDDFSMGMRLNDPISVLVVEDDAWSRDILVSLLEKAGCQIVEAKDGEEAIQAFQLQRPDIVMTDIRMPKKSGVDLLHLIRQEEGAEAIPVIAVTASTLEHEQQALLEQGFWEVVAKPYQIEDIYRTLTRYLDVQFVPQLDGHLTDFDKTVSKEPAYAEASEVLGMTSDKSLDADALPQIDWQPLLMAAQSGDVEAVEQAFAALKDQLAEEDYQPLKQAIESFDFGFVEQRIVNDQNDQ
ncbi:PAS domain-containing hybrid sensor histidine kinase/response regulator [Marinomonas posidonica]|uniref:histidine kinase n=1 Tax=Marinomonas posidonica (strain CECT 7376 / NCIMB 14433 / IVIA-Po-181) TaxID=491952 RepID=F6CST5_MARPP|nr:ATP-binding protein [Marinomonas posidonica]AEF53925.1 PAS/PAC sensor hybrid histidine kinase [Marinomonas posidonica IVIA-Po-181]